jgi:hypothetical protein
MTQPRPPSRALIAAARDDTWTYCDRFRGALTRAVRVVAIAGHVLLGWLAAIPRRLGDRLFAMNDAEAYWHNWQIIRTHGGLGRRYRDPQFSTPWSPPR